MSQITLAEIKRYCQAEGFDDDDLLLGDLQSSAEAFVKDYTRRDFDEETPAAWPKACVAAVKFLVETWYDEREAAVPQAVRDMLAAHRDLS